METPYNEELEQYLSGLNINKDEFTSQEKLVIRKIISQIERTGRSNLLDSLYMEDYDEKPVSVERFLTDPEYAGNTTDRGNGIWPFWKGVLSEIYSPKFQYVKVIFGGSIGTGKSSIACLGISYTIYKLLCLKNPADYYGVLKGSKPGVALFNITLDKGFGVAFHKINSICKNSPWFLRNGSVVGSNRNEVYLPGKDVTIGVGSMADHFIGLDIFCLHGDTRVATTDGVYKISELQDREVQLYCFDPISKEIEISDYCYIRKTVTSEIITTITLIDGETIRCTPNHKFLIVDKGYVPANKICPFDKIQGLNFKAAVLEVETSLAPPTDFYSPINVYPHNNFLICCSYGGELPYFLVSHNCTMMDEMSFKDNKELDMQKMKAYDALQAIDRRMVSRFMNKGLVPGISYLVSSTRTEDDFLTQYKETRKNDPRTYIVEKPLYEVVPASRYRGETFPLALGTKSADQFIITEPEVEDFKSRGYQIYNIPVEHYDEFKNDIQGAIRDILGVPLKTAGKFIDAEKIDNAVNPELRNIFSTTDIPIGFSDDSSILDYLVLGNINQKLIHYPIFIHHDLSLGGDGTGIFAQAVCMDTSDINGMSEDEMDDWRFIPVFWMRLVPKVKGEQIPYYKIRRDILRLRDVYGFNILGVTADGYQSADMLQQYALQGLWTEVLSMDRAPSAPYQFARTCLYDGRSKIPNDPLLIKELKQLVENRRMQKVDHPVNGSKDLADAYGGSMYAAVEFNKKKRKIFESGKYTLSDLIVKKDKEPNRINQNNLNSKSVTGLLFDEFSEDSGGIDW